MALPTALRTRIRNVPSSCDCADVIRRPYLLFTIWLICNSNPTDAFGTMDLKNAHIRVKSQQEIKIQDLSTKPRVNSYNMPKQTAKYSQAKNGSIRQYPACPIPQLNPFHESILPYVNDKMFPVMYNCTGFYPLLFNSTLQSTLIPAKGPVYFREEGYESCCYRTVWRVLPTGEDIELLSPQCYPIHLSAETKVPDGHEFIAIFCKKKGNPKEILVDVHSFVHLKPSSIRNNSDEIQEGKFNVIIFGMDGISRLHFLRAMPQSYSFLKHELDSVEMLGYNKVGENTPPNLMPLLMGGMPHGRDFNKIPFIWKDYSTHGYYTMFSEDESRTLFNDVGLSFDRRSTDYYLRPFSQFSDNKFKTYACYGPRLTFQYLLDHMEKYVDTMSRNRKNFFGLTWGSALTHSYISTAPLGDPLLLKSLRWLKESGHLKNTIFVLMSDHGIRLDAIRNTIQGQMEERLPLLHLVVPHSFKMRYPLAYSNLLHNADKLVTTYDLHASLQDIVNLDMIENRKLLQKKDALHRLGRHLPRGISLFLPIPEFRTCEMAGIRKNFCSCTYMEVANVSDPEINVIAKANIALSHINSILRSNSTNCAILKLHKVTMVRRVGHSTDFFWNGYAINFETTPGGGQFEALVAQDRYGITWNVQGPIVRTNLNGNQSRCTHVPIAVKPYCYCVN